MLYIELKVTIYPPNTRGDSRFGFVNFRVNQKPNQTNRFYKEIVKPMSNKEQNQWIGFIWID